ncbi:hypothetical protein OAM92_00185 [Acidimicrobiales bacterium]|jgi:hypothetical protein|nr:hypothetical protein [Acidimicrobiales bacterium]
MARSSHLSLVPESVENVALTIDCEECVVQFTDACDDCVVSYLIEREPGTPVLFDDDERHAIDLLADAGLVPPSRFRSRDVG